MSAATRSESALVRPFAGIGDADAPLQSVRLLVDAEEFEPGSVVLPEESLAQATITIKLPPPDAVRANVEKTPVPVVDCGLVVMATARSHRATRILVQEYLRLADWPEELILERAHDDLILRDQGGFTLTVAIVLLNDLTPEPLRPNLAGTWLARREFRVSPEADDISFSPEALTEEIRKAYDLPPGVLRYVHVDELLGEEQLSDAVHVYVDPDVLNLLLASPTDAISIQMQIELAIQATETVAIAIVKDLSTGEAPATADSLTPYPAAKRFIENLAKTLNVTVADVLDLAGSQQAVLRSHLEAAFKMRDATSSALKEK